jgi:3-oxoacyl-(acyl-carrier-protein) synthase
MEKRKGPYTVTQRGFLGTVGAGAVVAVAASSALATGAKGLGEPVTIPTAAAIANAVYHATGVRVTETPINPYRLSAIFAERIEEK